MQEKHAEAMKEVQAAHATGRDMLGQEQARMTQQQQIDHYKARKQLLKQHQAEELLLQHDQQQIAIGLQQSQQKEQEHVCRRPSPPPFCINLYIYYRRWRTRNRSKSNWRKINTRNNLLRKLKRTKCKSLNNRRNKKR